MKKLLLSISVLASASMGFSQCSDLIISEYFESNVGSNKMLEVYNASGSGINLSTYQLKLYVNGGTAPTGNNIFQFPNIVLPSGSTYVIVNSLASFPVLLNTADTLVSGAGNICNFNGDDAIGLFNGTTQIDVLGIIGNDPGTSWTWGTFNTMDKDLVRKATIQQGVTSFDSTIAVNNWDVYAVNDSSHVGAHTMNPCVAPIDTIVDFASTSNTVNEGAVVNLNLALAYGTSTAQSVQVVLKSGDPADVNGYTTQTVNFAAGVTTGSVSVTVTDDAIQEGAEPIVFAIRNISSSLTLGTDSLYTLTIAASDQPFNPGVPFYSIAQVRGANNQGQADSNGVACGVGGRVYGINTRTTGLSFTINDGTAGMNVFSPTNTFGYTVTEGDSVVVYGEVATFRGLAQMSFVDTILVISTGHPMPVTPTVTSLNESTEGELIRMNHFTVINAAQWTNNVNGFTVDVTDGSATFQLRIERNTTAIPMAAPTGLFDVIGIGSQFATTTTAPYTDGYQIVPRKIEDILLNSGIEDESAWNVSMYPNPSTGTLNITSLMNDYTLQVIDLTGKAVITKNGLSQNTQVDLSNLSNGIYLVKLNQGNNQVTRKIILKK